MEHSFEVREKERERENNNGFILTLPSSSFLQGRKSGKDEDAVPDKLEVGANETINVFSIASGHLYERFLRYMHVCVCVLIPQRWCTL